jgi:hypothetical protein
MNVLVSDEGKKLVIVGAGWRACFGSSFFWQLSKISTPVKINKYTDDSNAGLPNVEI